MGSHPCLICAAGRSSRGNLNEAEKKGREGERMWKGSGGEVLKRRASSHALS